MYRRILVPVDGSEPSLSAAGHALELAVIHDAAVHLLHVIDWDAYRVHMNRDRDAIEGGALLDELKSRWGTEVTGDVAGLGEDLGVETVEAVEIGRPYEQILEYASESDIDLIVMGRTGTSGLRGMVLGSVSRSVSQATDLPVLLIRGDENAPQ